MTQSVVAHVDFCFASLTILVTCRGWAYSHSDRMVVSLKVESGEERSSVETREGRSTGEWREWRVEKSYLSHACSDLKHGVGSGASLF